MSNSSDMNDAAQIFAKMQQLQKSIDESKKSLASNQQQRTEATSTLPEVPIGGRMPPKFQASPSFNYWNGAGGFVSRGRGRGRGSMMYRGGFQRGGYRMGYNARGRGNGVRKVPYRNMSLVVKNNTSDPTSSASTPEHAQERNEQFVSKQTKNGLTLVNTKIYQNDAERQRIIAQKVLQNKLDKLQYQKRLKIQQKLQELSVKYDYCNRAYVNSIEMAVVNDGVRLVPISFIEDKDYKNKVEFENFNYSKLGDGSYLREGHEESELAKLEEEEPCRFFTRTGTCSKGKACKYTHNPANISLCKEFLKNQCPNPNCPLLHRPTQFNSPSCRFYQNGYCSNGACLFTHKQEKENVTICRNFSVGGFCRLGKYCPAKHSFDCPDFVEKHNCPRGKNCSLIHHLSNHQIVNGPSNSSSASVIDIVRNEDNEPKGINYNAREHSLTLDIGSSDDDEDEEVNEEITNEPMEDSEDYIKL